ncbi:MAG: succinate dehydrogenase cytochrome b subunit [Myxococcota bacterium]|nr:succinate dehydrogenase cytochrome b subunit [Myxococcota bacterium]
MKRVFGSTVGTKVVVGLTGLGLVIFVITHLLGNLTVFGGPEVMNKYAAKLHELGPLLLVAEIGLLVTFLVHIIFTVRLTLANRAAKGTGYRVSASKQTGFVALMASKTMAISGLIVLAFLVVHIWDMRLQRDPDGKTYELMVATLGGSSWRVALYTVGSLLVGWHLSHGFQSAFRSLGFSHGQGQPLVARLGTALAFVLGVGFACIPLWIAFGRG